MFCYVGHPHIFIRRVRQYVLYPKKITIQTMKTIIQFGENVPGYDIPVLNEREIRAAAGILFLVIYTSLMLILFNGDFRLAKYAIAVFLVDFIVRVFINPRFSPSLIVGRMIVSNQVHNRCYSVRLHVCLADCGQCIQPVYGYNLSLVPDFSVF